MKKVYFFLIFVVSALTVHAQAPESINYQAVARDASGNLIANQAVSFRLSILQGGSSGTMVYQETHAVTTNAFGMANLSIGTGIVTFGSFPIIDWGANTIWLKTELDPSGGSSYLLMGTSRFLSVPYALYSKSSGSSGSSLPTGTAGQTLRSDGNSWIADSTIYNDGTKIGIGTVNPDNSAMLDLYSVRKGFLPPRMNHVEMNAIPDPAAGLMVFCTDCGANGTEVVVVFMNGAWSTMAINCILPNAPAIATQIPSPAQITWNWYSVPGANGYKWNTTDNFGTATNCGASTTKTETGLSCNTLYKRYVWAYNTCGSSVSNTLTQTTSLSQPPAPTAGVHLPAATQVVWNWNPVIQASGYKWNTLNDYNTATDLGNNTSKTETGLTCNTPYTRYVWAYSNCGVSNTLAITQTTSLDPPATPTAGNHIPSASQIIWNWNTVPLALGYKWNTVNDYNTATDLGNNTSKTETGLLCNTSYTRYVWEYTGCGPSSSVALTEVTSLNAPPAPTASTHLPSSTQIVWNWTSLPQASGYKWNIVNDYNTATDMGNTLSKTETGLTCNTPYTRYIWAYSNCGVSGSTILTQTTSFSPPSSPTAATHIPSPTKIVWNWNTVLAATGYRWNTTNDYGSAVDLASATTFTETGLACGTNFMRYIWAYNNCGVSVPASITQSTTSTVATPVSGTHIASGTQIGWNWNPVEGATGYKWNTTANYTTASDLGALLTKTETGLNYNTSYTRYIWAYNTCGYSTVTTISQSTSSWYCGLPMIDVRDSKTYNTVQIGTQCWLAQNLNVGTRINNTVAQSNNGVIEKLCYNNDEANCDIYGGLYNWSEMMNYSGGSNSNPSGVTGICPPSWHIPSDAEWCQMEIFLDASISACAPITNNWYGTDIGGKMKETGLAHWESPNFGATNSSGFTTLGGGAYYDNAFIQLSTRAWFWTAKYDGYCVFRFLGNDSQQVYKNHGGYSHCMSARCIKD